MMKTQCKYFLSLSLIALPTALLASSAPYQKFLQLINQSAADGNPYAKRVTLGTVYNNKPHARIVTIHYQKGAFYFQTSVHSHKVRDLKANPFVSITFSLLSKNHLDAVVIYGKAKLDKNTIPALKNRHSNWVAYRITPSDYRFSIGESAGPSKPWKGHIQHYKRRKDGTFAVIVDKSYPWST